MADILIRDVEEGTAALLQRRADRRGTSLEAELREALDALARQEADAPDTAAPFGDWLHAISRPGADFDATLALLRAGPPRVAPLE